MLSGYCYCASASQLKAMWNACVVKLCSSCALNKIGGMLSSLEFELFEQRYNAKAVTCHGIPDWNGSRCVCIGWVLASCCICAVGAVEISRARYGLSFVCKHDKVHCLWLTTVMLCICHACSNPCLVSVLGAFDIRALCFLLLLGILCQPAQVLLFVGLYSDASCCWAVLWCFWLLGCARVLLVVGL